MNIQHSLDMPSAGFFASIRHQVRELCSCLKKNFHGAQAQRHEAGRRGGRVFRISVSNLFPSSP